MVWGSIEKKLGRANWSDGVVRCAESAPGRGVRSSRVHAARFISTQLCRRGEPQQQPSRHGSFRFFFDESQKHHPGDIGSGGDVESRGKAVVLHDVADDQGPDRAGDEAHEIVNRKSGVGELFAGKVADHCLRERAARLYEGAVEKQIDVEQNTQARVLDEQDGHHGGQQ